MLNEYYEKHIQGKPLTEENKEDNHIKGLFDYELLK